MDAQPPAGLKQQAQAVNGLPADMQSILSIPSPSVPGAQSMGNPSLYGSGGEDMGAVYGYADGGLIGPGGAPAQPLASDISWRGGVYDFQPGAPQGEVFVPRPDLQNMPAEQVKWYRNNVGELQPLFEVGAPQMYSRDSPEWKEYASYTDSRAYDMPASPRADRSVTDRDRAEKYSIPSQTSVGGATLGFYGNNTYADHVIAASQPHVVPTVSSMPQYPMYGTAQPSPINQYAPYIMMTHGFAEGGLVTEDAAPQGVPPGGMPGEDPATGIPMGGQGQAPEPLPPAEIEAEVNRFLQQNPQQVQQIQQIFMELITSGDLSPDTLNLIEQMANAALQNPQLYPQLRQYAIQQGLATEQDISPQYDQGLLFVLLLAARATKEAMGAQGVQTLQPQQTQNFACGGLVTPRSNARDGGKVVGPGTGTSDSIPIRVSAGEYVIPAHVVRAKGTEFFDKMLANYDTAAEKK